MSGQYRYKINDDEVEWSAWAALGAFTTSADGTFSNRFQIDGLGYNNYYIVQVKVSDALVTVSPEDFITMGTPVFDWSKSDFQFNVPVVFNEGAIGAGGNPLFTCDTLSSVAVKVINEEIVPTFTNGSVIYVKFLYSNSATAPVLKFNGNQYPVVNPSGGMRSSWTANSITQFIFQEGVFNIVKFDGGVISGTINTNQLYLTDQLTATIAGDTVDGWPAVNITAQGGLFLNGNEIKPPEPEEDKTPVVLYRQWPSLTTSKNFGLKVGDTLSLSGLTVYDRIGIDIVFGNNYVGYAEMVVSTPTGNYSAMAGISVPTPDLMTSSTSTSIVSYNAQFSLNYSRNIFTFQKAYAVRPMDFVALTTQAGARIWRIRGYKI
ncbi:hypothetical protein LJC34_02540 [Oscillospiraceae bacterium OttesenSCG-928-G22]|nr:hypothetical protein [Oscillospiraceae bacterium OttesenSCG-928-G22]